MYKIEEVFNKIKRDKNLFIGFYGGGNYGDELIMEILMNYNEIKHINAYFLFLNRIEFSKFHRRFKYSRTISIKEFFFKSLEVDNIIFGGGGLFSEDSNIKHIVLLFYLFFLKKIFRKRILFVGIGFYKGVCCLQFLRKMIILLADSIYVRDIHSYELLKSKKTVLDVDVSFLLKKMDLEDKYNCDLLNIDSKKKYIVFSIRNNSFDYKNEFLNLIEKLIEKNNVLSFIFWEMDPYNGKFSDYFRKYNNVLVLKNSNPLNIFYFFKKYSKNMKFIVPQFHGIITAYLLSIPFFPIYYAYKGKNFLEAIGYTPINIKDISLEDLEKFIK